MAVGVGRPEFLAPAPRILGGPLVMQSPAQDLEWITGGKAYVEYDPEKAAAGMIAHIAEKRAAFGNLRVMENAPNTACRNH